MLLLQEMRLIGVNVRFTNGYAIVFDEGKE